MELYIGGCYQGKLEYVLKQCKLRGLADMKIYDGKDYPTDHIEHAGIINGYHRLVKKLVNTNNALDYTKKILEHNPDIIIICDEIGMGIIPNSVEEIRYREMAGECTCYLAKEAKHVERIICGLSQKIK